MKQKDKWAEDDLLKMYENYKSSLCQYCGISWLAGFEFAKEKIRTECAHQEINDSNQPDAYFRAKVHQLGENEL